MSTAEPEASAGSRSHRLLAAMAAGALLGGVFGWVAPERAAQVGILGELWLLPLRMTVIPLIVFSVVHGVSSIGDSGRLGRLGSATAIYYLGTTACAIGLGVVAVTVIAPGEGVDLLGAATPDVATSAAGRTDWQDVLRNLLSPNLVASATAGDLVPLILFALAFGIALSMIGDRGRPVSELVEGVFAAILKMVHGIILLGPIGVFGLVAARLGAAGGSEGIVALLTGLGWFTLTVVGGLAIHGILTLGLVLTLVARRDPFAYARDLGTPLTTAFATASSSATLPLTLDAVEEAGVDANVSRFVLPLGATVNMDGSALYEAVAAVFIAQAVGVDLDAGAMVALFVTATLSTIGAAGIPEAGLVTMVVVLEAVGLPLEGLGLLLAIDWLIDRFRTAVNVWGDAVGAAAVGAVVGDAGER